MAEMTDTISKIRETLRERYAGVAKAAAEGAVTDCASEQGSCCGGPVALTDASGQNVHEHATSAIVRAHKAGEPSV